MSEPSLDEVQARRALAQAEAAHKKQPHDLAVQERLARALVGLIDALLHDGRSTDAISLAERALTEARVVLDRAPGDRDGTLVLADAHDRRARVIDELVLDAEIAARLEPNTVPDHLPPDPEDVPAEWRKALELLEPLASKKGDDVDVLERLAALHGRIAIWLDDHARREESFGHHRAALVCAERVARIRPRDHVSKGALALAHNALGHHYAEGDQLEDAIRHHDASRALNEWLVRRDPKDSHWRHCLGIDLENLCDSCTRLGDRKRALEYADQCVRVREVLCARRDSTAERRSQLADAHRDVAELSMDLGEADQALPHYRAMLGILGELAAERPADVDLQFRLADGQLVLGYALEDQGKLRDAVAVYRTALDTDSKLSQLEPNEARWRANTAHCHLCLALVLLDLGDADESATHADLGLSILTAELGQRRDDRGLLNDLATFHGELARAFANHGMSDLAIDHHGAAEAIDRRLLELDPTDKDALAGLAATYDALAELHEYRGDVEDALRCSREVMRADERLAASDPESVEYRTRLAQATIHYAHALLSAQQPAEAQTELGRVGDQLARLARLVPKDDGVRTLRAQVDRVLGETLRELGETDAAETHMKRALDTLRAAIETAADPKPYFLHETEALESLGELRLELGRASEAKDDLEQALRRRRRAASEVPDDAWAQRDLARTLDALGDCYEALGELDDAQRVRAESARITDRFGEP